MSDSFFASTKKRKRNDKLTSRIVYPKEKKINHDEEISGSESDSVQEISDIESETDPESARDKRIRLAKDYLNSLKNEIAETDFNAEDIDRDILAERLRDDALEIKGKIFLRLASTIDLAIPVSISFLKRHKGSVTCVAVCKDLLFSVSKDSLLIKWDISNPKNPVFVASVTGNRKGDCQFQGHTAEISAVEVSNNGKWVVTAGQDGRIVVRLASNLQVVRCWKHHRGAVNDISFRQKSNQMFSCSADRTIKSWQLDQMTYVETLFGHQDSVISISAFSNERCVSTGSRDRTARVWKLVDETQLVFRGESNLEAGDTIEGSMDCVCIIDEEHFVTASDNGSIRLWNVARKKAVYTLQAAHGYDLPDVSNHSAETSLPTCNLSPQPRWITALGSIPYSDLFISGSWDRTLNLYKISPDLKSFTKVGKIPVEVNGIVNKICVTERGKRGIDGITIAIAVGCETRIGRWKIVQGAKNGVLLICLKTR